MIVRVLKRLHVEGIQYHFADDQSGGDTDVSGR